MPTHGVPLPARVHAARQSVTLAKLEEMEKRAAGLAAQQQEDMDAGMDRYR